MNAQFFVHQQLLKKYTKFLFPSEKLEQKIFARNTKNLSLMCENG